MSDMDPDDPTIGPRVLVVEDDRVQAFLVREALAGSGFSDIRVAPTAREARQELASWRPDLVMLDLGLPDADGMSILELIAPRGPLGIPALVVTAETDPDRHVHALELGASDVVTKPFNLLELGVRAKRTLRTHDDLAAAGLLARGLAQELTELSSELEHNLAVATDTLVAALALRSPALGTRARRVGRSVHQLAVAVRLDDLAAQLGQAATCHEIGALTLLDEDLAGVLAGEPTAAARCEIASRLILAERHPLAAVATRFRAGADSFERNAHRVMAQLTAVCHVFHAAAQDTGTESGTFDAARGVAALRPETSAGLDRGLVEAFLDVCMPAATPRDIE
jgi:DNA-binding response OmpR family regulator